jgi:23S rRNA (guanosine2251-2'-O)-methyltransferase
MKNTYRPRPHRFADTEKRGKFGPAKPGRDKASGSGKEAEPAQYSSRPDARKKPYRHKERGHGRQPDTTKREPLLRQDTDKSARDTILIWGLHAAQAAWLNPKRRCFRLWLTEAGHKAFEKNFAEANELLLKRPDPKRVERYELDRITPPGSVHQGVVLEVYPLPEPALHEVIADDNPPDLLLMLDQVTDPHNVGAILRSAAAFNAGAVIMTERNAPGTTGVLAKTASGAAEHVPVIHVVNLARALDELQEAGYWRVGLAEEGAKNLGELDLSGRTVLVLGAEGEGLRQLTRKKCDELARLPTGGPIGSLNVSNAAAVALYEVRR